MPWGMKCDSRQISYFVFSIILKKVVKLRAIPCELIANTKNSGECLLIHSDMLTYCNGPAKSFLKVGGLLKDDRHERESQLSTGRLSYALLNTYDGLCAIISHAARAHIDLCRRIDDRTGL